MIIIRTSSDNRDLKKYVFDVLFDEFLGLNYECVFDSDDDFFELGINGKTIRISNIFFKKLTMQYKSSANLPTLPLDLMPLSSFKNLKKSHDFLPILFGDKISLSECGYVGIESNKIHIGIDIFGSAFFLLTCYEEWVASSESFDGYSRFKSEASILFKSGLIERPILNEYLELLWYFIYQAAPNLSRKKRNYRVRLTHDVDWVYFSKKLPFKVVIKNCLKTFLFNKSLYLPLRILWVYFLDKLKLSIKDPADTFNFILHTSIQYGLTNSFYFICDCLVEKDAYYSVSKGEVDRLVKRLADAGCEIGMHASFSSSLNGDQIKKEVNVLRNLLKRMDIPSSEIGGRHHYLKWRCPETWRYWDEAGLSYDSTLSFFDASGFRCGICYNFPVFDLEYRRPLRLREYPLIVMDASLLAYKKLSRKKCLAKISELSSLCKFFDGEFVILWHNTSIMTLVDKFFYKKICKIINYNID